GAEALSGLARAFIYAQARALLVSHWAVNSQATVKLITGALSRIAADKFLSRAEAMRQAMLALIDGNELRVFVPRSRRKSSVGPTRARALLVGRTYMEISGEQG